MARQTIDFTEMTGDKIEKCPKCGRMGRVSHYTNGQSHYVHKQQLGIVPIAWEVTDSCLIPAGGTRIA